MLRFVMFRYGLKADFLYHEGVLLVNASLPAARVLEIIGMFLGGDDAGE